MPYLGFQKRGMAARILQHMVDNEEPKIGPQRMQGDPCTANRIRRDWSAFGLRYEGYVSFLQEVSHKEGNGPSLKKHASATDAYWTPGAMGLRSSNGHFQPIG